MKKRIVIPALCFAVMSTPAFAKSVHAASSPASKTVVKYVDVQKGSNLLLRAKASKSGTVLARLPRGTSVTVYSVSGGWSKVKAAGKTGYVSTAYLAAAKPASTQAGSAVKTVTKYVNIDKGSNLLLRSEPSKSASVLAKLPRGASVTVYSISGSWAKIKANGNTGFVYAKYLSTAKIATSPQTVTKYVDVDPDSSLLLRKTASEKGTVLARLKRGTSIKVLSVSGSWAKISVSGKTGYAKASYLSATKPAAVAIKYVNVPANDPLNMRTAPSASASIITKLARGVKVEVYAETTGWSKIKVYGTTGYVSSKSLSTTKPSGSASPGGSTGTSSGGVSNTGTSNTGGKAGSVTSGTSNTGTTGSTANGTVNTGTSVGQTSGASNTGGTTAGQTTGTTSGGNPASGTTTTNGTSTGQNTSSAGSSASNTGSSGSGTSPQQTPAVTKYVNVQAGSALNMRQAPSTSASIITQLARGTAVQVISETGGWSKVTANGTTGYVSSQYLSETPVGTSIIDKTYQSYSVSLDQMAGIEMAAYPQTDKKYSTYIRSDALIVDDTAHPTKGVVFGSGWNVRGGAGTNYWVVGQVLNGETVEILSVEKGTDGKTWYKISYNKTWVNASPDDVKYYLDPTNFANDPVQSLQFLKLSETAGLDKEEVNEKILAGKGVLSGQAESFITAADLYGINEIYLIAHALLETGNGTSELAQGVQYKGRTVYNMYGICAYDDSPVESGAEYAYNAGWFTPEAAIIGGAQFIASGYIRGGQDTLYKMRWNPAAAAETGSASHQYATDIGWAAKQVTQMYNLYHLLNTYRIQLEIPQYKP
ncbi:hypothetical protein BpJC4_16030 [Weizmannia acidilactici]|uniref:SH3 domain-containing protein n=1 Tax=Weizmannia acidilactici TaxID=2607726 RepID=UPI00124E15F6|nr:SH3 domain-containing protein [Weizmannia acidilactici]GER67132.1 hypothetical protein BpJC4_16030 [Weizmannia acidilactici]